MTNALTEQQAQDHFAHCVQVFGGISATSRRLGIDERALRRFINGERPVSAGLLEDTRNALRQLITEATSAEAQIVVAVGG
jgi:DNA-binding transcriptional regulator YdaS (Cro superfamily)